jgi:hypothetical protein
MTKTYTSDREFYAENPARARSAEWDYGVHWVDDDRLTAARHRVTWIVDTGEVIAVNLWTGTIAVLGIVPPVGQYPHGVSHPKWHVFATQQTVERVLDGWEYECGKPDSLQWVRNRLAGHTEEVAAA